MLKSIDVERESRIAFLLEPDDSVISRFNNAVLHVDDVAAQQRLLKAWVYAQSLDYHHPGQSKELYLAHPLRVATLYMQLILPIDEAGVVTAILHNVKEVSNAQNNKLVQIVGMEVANAIATLTVDRERQWDNDYKSAYYKEIENSPEFVPRVKILDKLDNLFLLCLNPSDEIREMYLNEVDKWLIPMAKRTLPQVADYLRELVKDNRRIGHKALYLDR